MDDIDNIPTTMTKEEFKDLLYESYVQKWSPTTFRRKLQPRLRLEKWTYPELRDVINNSSDVKEIENCQKELHRREEAYYDWKVKNRKSKDVGAIVYPVDIGSSAASAPLEQHVDEAKIDCLRESSAPPKLENAPGSYLHHTSSAKQKEVYDNLMSKHDEEHRLNAQLEQDEDKEPVDEEIPSSTQDQKQLPIKQNYDLSKWKSSELRDAINSSCDFKFLEACLHEFHRRLYFYNTNNVDLTTMDQKQEVKWQHRFFKVIFYRPSANPNEPTNRGWMYLHFYGQSIVRQMELSHVDRRPPILLVTGIDDRSMCKLGLEQTEMIRTRGAEILEHEFNQEWIRNGGQPYEKVSTFH